MSATARQIFVAEPPAQYLQRQPLVVDASLLCAVLFDEPERADAMQRLAGKALLAPRLLDHEIVSVAVRKQRHGMPWAAVETALADYAEQGIELLDTELQVQCSLALRYGISGYDAAYLWLASELKVPLATFDRQLAEAASRHLGTLQ